MKTLAFKIIGVLKQIYHLANLIPFYLVSQARIYIWLSDSICFLVILEFLQ